MATTEGQHPNAPKEEVSERDRAYSAFNRAHALFGVGESIEEEEKSDKKERRIVLKDGVEIRIVEVLGRGEMFSVGVSKEGSDIVGFSLNTEGLYAINTGESYVTRTSFLGTRFEDSGMDEDFKDLSLPVVNWLGVSIFSEKLQPFPEEAASRIKEIASLVG